MSNHEGPASGISSQVVTSIAMARSYDSHRVDEGLTPKPDCINTSLPLARNRVQTVAYQLGEALLKAVALPVLATYKLNGVPEEIHFER